MLATPQPTLFLIADISGYTGYLTTVELDHAQDILADLISTIVTSLQPALTLSKLEGDAAFMFSTGHPVDGTALLDSIERCYFGFRRRRRDVRQATSCDCNACSNIPSLDLKFVAHYGEAIFQPLADHQELVGVDAIVVHRLLKNDVVETLEMGAYALLTQACLDAARLDPSALGMRPSNQRYEQIGEVPAWAHDLDRRWAEEEERTRVIVSPDEAVLALDVPVRVPPQVAWEFLTRPGQRMSWQPWVTDVTIKGDEGGRRGLGSANHCMHGEDAVIEEIRDWRPYDYVTDMTILDTPLGPVSALHTTEFEPTADGTVIHMRFGAPETEREREAMQEIGRVYGSALESAVPQLIDQLEAGFVRSTAGRGNEPSLPVPTHGAVRT